MNITRIIGISRELSMRYINHCTNIYTLCSIHHLIFFLIFFIIVFGLTQVGVKVTWPSLLNGLLLASQFVLVTFTPTGWGWMHFLKIFYLSAFESFTLIFFKLCSIGFLTVHALVCLWVCVCVCACVPEREVDNCSKVLLVLAGPLVQLFYSNCLYIDKNK